MPSAYKTSGVCRSFLLALLFFLQIWVVGAAQAGTDYSKNPVFFVHGHGMSAGSWDKIISFLVKSGYPAPFLKAIELRPNTGANISVAEKEISPAIEGFLENVNKLIKKEKPSEPLKAKVDLISHSMGALSARWYAAKVGPHRVNKWISLAGANHGSNVLCAWKDPGAQDLCPAYAKSATESFIQFALNGEGRTPDIDETPYGIGEDSSGLRSVRPDENKRILYVSIRTSPDKWIKPENSAILDGAGGVLLRLPANRRVKETSTGNFLMTNRVGHDEMLSDPETLNLVKTILESNSSN
jgi:pimeloyl-ACP methyl ester carboxylesterase